MINLHYNVAPRYTAGSPAMVDEKTAKRVARDEEEAYWHAMRSDSDPNHDKAIKLGRAGIVTCSWEEPAPVNRLFTFDMMTLKRTSRRAP